MAGISIDRETRYGERRILVTYRAFHGFGAKGRTGGPEAISSVEN